MIEMEPIGTIYTPFKDAQGTPIQPVGAKDAEGVVELLPEYAEGLTDLADFSHVILLYHCHHTKGYKLKVTPFLDTVERGLFATRAPARPNAIGISTVRLLGIEGNRLRVGEVDIIDGTPLLDIKPYVPKFDVREDAKAGWLDRQSHATEAKRDDGRFTR